MDHLRNDNFRNRGAVEQEAPGQHGNLCFRGQLGHRNKDPLIDSYDTDFPEPGENAEHTGEMVMENKNTEFAPAPKPQNKSPKIEENLDHDPGA